MNENNGRLVFLWSGADSRSTLGADSQWFPRLVLTPSKAQVLTPRSYLLFFRSFNFVLVVLRQFWYQSKHRSVEASPQERTRKYHPQKKRKKPTRSTPTASKHQPPAAETHKINTYRPKTQQPPAAEPIITSTTVMSRAAAAFPVVAPPQLSTPSPASPSPSNLLSIQRFRSLSLVFVVSFS